MELNKKYINKKGNLYLYVESGKSLSRKTIVTRKINIKQNNYYFRNSSIIRSIQNNMPQRKKDENQPS